MMKSDHEPRAPTRYRASRRNHAGGSLPALSRPGAVGVQLGRPCEMRPDSDIDILVEFLPGAEIDLVDYAGLMLDLSTLLARKVDLVSKNGIKPLIRSAVLEEAQLLYAA